MAHFQKLLPEMTVLWKKNKNEACCLRSTWLPTLFYGRSVLLRIMKQNGKRYLFTKFISSISALTGATKAANNLKHI